MRATALYATAVQLNWTDTTGGAARFVVDCSRERLQSSCTDGGNRYRGKSEHVDGAKVTVSGNLGDDARAYQELDVARAIQESQR